MDENLVYDPIALGLKVFGQNGDEAICLCPFHDDRHPSSSFNVRLGWLHCFTCGTNANAEKVAEEMDGEIIMISPSELTANRKKEPLPIHWVHSAPLALNNPYLISRGVTNEQVRKFKIKEIAGAVGVPFFDGRGNLVGAQFRYHSHRYLKYVNFGYKPALWPLEQVGHGVHIVEGIFGVIQADKANVRAVATIGAGLTKQTIALVGALRDTTVVFDPDEAGYMGAAKLIMWSNSRSVIPFVIADSINWRYELPERTTNSLKEIVAMSREPNKILRAFR